MKIKDLILYSLITAFLLLMCGNEMCNWNEINTLKIQMRSVIIAEQSIISNRNRMRI